MRQLIARAKTQAADKWFRHLVRKSLGYRCCLEKRYSYGWARCGAQAPDIAHIVSRAQAPAAKHDPRNGIPACRPCHTKLDARDESVRVPLKYWNAAVKAVNELSKVPFYGEWRGKS